jgi:hypothetical protein
MEETEMKKKIKTWLKVFMVIVWTVVVMMGVLMLTQEVTKDYTRQGTNLTFNILSRDIEIKKTDAIIQIEGASKDYFQLKKTDEILYSTPIKPPLDYDYDTYFTLSKNNISEGKWEVSNDKSVTFNLISNKPIEVIFHDNGTSGFLSLVILSGLLCWLLGFMAIDDFVNKKFVIKD